jgi:hypothetical protein
MVATRVSRGLRRRRTMKSILGVWLSILLMPSAYAASSPGDSADGKRLHDANCVGCHDTAIYTRRDRIVGSLDALKKRLGDCSHMAKKESPRVKCRTSSSTSTISFINSARSAGVQVSRAVMARGIGREKHWSRRVWGVPFLVTKALRL